MLLANMTQRRAVGSSASGTAIQPGASREGESTLRISVIGTGYLGATHAACLAHMGHHVLGVDVDSNKVARLQSGELPFYEPELDALVREHLSDGSLRFSESFDEAAKFADVHFLAVGTPQSTSGPGADLAFIRAAVDALAPHLDRPALIAGKSTVPV
ncbi:MAG: UDPglucose 6-dehydrogenase, partial [Mycobacterium sp.]|nr:UDPglucose 6-dehydrogenase [Mycobacterium sp.]